MLYAVDKYVIFHGEESSAMASGALLMCKKNAHFQEGGKVWDYSEHVSNRGIHYDSHRSTL